MKVLAPIRSCEEFEMLVENGAEELYCGMVPQPWLKLYKGSVWFDRRPPKGAGLESLEELKRLTAAAHARAVPLFVVLNAPYYCAGQMRIVLDFAERLSGEIGADALIVSDINLLLRLSELRLAAALHVSSVAATLNSEAVRFLLNFGPKRIILPRSLSLVEIGELVADCGSQVEFEVFVLNDGCAFEEGFCFTTHHHSVGAFCTGLTKMDTELVGNGRPLSEVHHNRLRQNLTDYHEWNWYLSGNGCAATPKGIPYGPCGLCAIPDFQRLGVAALKIAGREAAALRKLQSVRMVADIVRHTRAAQSPPTLRERARSLRESPEHCDSGYMCYYRL